MKNEGQLLLDSQEPQVELETFDVEASRMALPQQLSLQESRLTRLNKELLNENTPEEEKPELNEQIEHATAQIALIKDRILGEAAMQLSEDDKVEISA